ncbi:MAG TPA: VOC family protein [Kofleriaceae bacterium]|nr:VOC family protein [Kofleriaceae bacterium]
MRLNQVMLPALNIAESKDFYVRMGFKLIVNSAHYVRFWVPDNDATFSLHAIEPDDETGQLPEVAALQPQTVIYFECDDVDGKVAELQGRGFVFEQLPQDEAWLWREARLSDPSGNVLCLYYGGKNRVNPPWKVR